MSALIINEIYYNTRYDSIAIFSTMGGIGLNLSESWVFIGGYEGKL